MDMTQIIGALAGTPLSLVLLYLLIKRDQELTETRKAMDTERREFWMQNASLAARVVEAVERLDLPGPK